MWGFMMNKALVVLKQRIFLLREIIRLECDRETMCRLGWGFQMALFPFMNPFHQNEVGVALLSLLA